MTLEPNSISKREVVQDDEISTEEAEVQQLSDLPRFSRTERQLDHVMQEENMDRSEFGLM